MVQACRSGPGPERRHPIGADQHINLVLMGCALLCWFSLVVSILRCLTVFHKVLRRLVPQLLQRLALPLVEVVVFDFLLVEDAADTLGAAISKGLLYHFCEILWIILVVL